MLHFFTSDKFRYRKFYPIICYSYLFHGNNVHGSTCSLKCFDCLTLKHELGLFYTRTNIQSFLYMFLLIVIRKLLNFITINCSRSFAPSYWNIICQCLFIGCPLLYQASLWYIVKRWIVYVYFGAFLLVHLIQRFGQLCLFYCSLIGSSKLTLILIGSNNLNLLTCFLIGPNNKSNSLLMWYLT